MRKTQSVDAVKRATQAPGRPDDPPGNPEHRQAIGWIGLVLPFALMAIARLRDGKDTTSLLDSISAYYYSGADTLFLGMLVSLSLFLFTYRGYDNEDNKKDRVAANWAAIGALLVAFFPTEAPTGITALTWWQPWMSVAHFGGALVLFLCFAYFALVLFTKRPKIKGEDQLSPQQLAKAKQAEAEKDPTKGTRNKIYVACGVVIIGCIVAVAWLRLHGDSIFIPEAIALVAFAFSWLVKGYSPEKLFGNPISGIWGLILAIARGVKWLVWPPAINVEQSK